MFLHHHNRGRGYGYSTNPRVFLTVLCVMLPIFWLVGTIEIWILDGGSLVDLLRSQWHYLTSFFQTHRIR